MSAAPGAALRSEADIVAEAVVRLIEAGMLAATPVVIRKAADVLGLPVSTLRDAWRRQETMGWTPPSTNTVCRNKGCTSIAPEGTLYCSRACQAEAWKEGSRPTPVETARINERSSRMTERYRTANPEPGKRRCARCHQVFDEDQFPVKDQRTGARRSYDNECWKTIQRERYLTVAKAEALDKARLEFVVGDCDEVELVCTDCGQPIKAGDHVYGESALTHVDCPKAAAASEPHVPDVGVSLLRALNELGGEVFDPSGRATAKLMDARRDVTPARIRQVLAVLDEGGYISRTVNGKRTSRIVLTAKGLAALDVQAEG